MKPRAGLHVYGVAVACCLSLAAIGCGGDDVVADTGAEGDTDGDGDGDATDSGDGDGEIPDAGMKLPARRLSHFEYQNTLRDLFPQIEVPVFEMTADPSSEGFDNDGEALVPSGLLIEQYDNNARELAKLAAQDLPGLLGCDPAEGESCAQLFVDAFGRRAFRRPLTAAERADFMAFFLESPGNADMRVGAELTIQLFLQSPQFLYRLELPAEGEEPPAEGELAPLGGYEVASRMSYFLWSSMPDETLLAAADDGALSTPAQLEAQARRMLADDRAKDAFLHFHEQWFDLGRIDTVSKLPEHNFDDQLRTSAKQEALRFVEHVIFDEDGTLGDLLTSNRTFVDDRLAPIYGVASPEPGVWAEVELDPTQRAGFMTQVAFLAGHGHPLNPSPVLRGVYSLKDVLCWPLGAPPPVAEAMMIPEAPDGQTNREAYEALTAADECQFCHEVINPVGFAFEHYDTLGAWRDQDNGNPVDASGQFQDAMFTGAPEMMSQLAQRPDVHRCVSKKWLRFAYGGGRVLLTPDILAQTEASFADADFSITELMVAIVTHPRFRTYAAPN
ncbi:Cellulose-binding domain protein [Enhygromyxa salina]|uniref:Cellulose-binding domain protein n=1 Tax=Enhygromyxa salina TaxID=215803 RepID=A0A0C2A7G8_9BACT|nr:DUF1592 domain-containing protein [Enhygromyxa salina]KIG19478.1 Cellulose-binding domain protein [Enhygromyxa salina]